jgi:hypothetical protein
LAVLQRGRVAFAAHQPAHAEFKTKKVSPVKNQFPRYMDQFLVYDNGQGAGRSLPKPFFSVRLNK